VAGNETFARATRAKQDEFYTQLRDIETELRHYRDQFRGKVVFCNCDDPYESNFFKFFAMNFGYLGLKKLISTSYTGSPITGEQLSLLDVDGMPADVPEKPAYRVEITEVPDANNDGAIDLYDVEYLLKHEPNVLSLLAGNGDFSSAECIALMDEADIVVTNPPFSLFRKYIAQLVEHGKQFLILGNLNAISYSEIFKLIKEDRLWLGYDNGGEKWFRVPDDYDHTTDKSKIKVEDGVRYLAMKNMAWFTNLDTSKRHELLTLYKRYNPEEYPHYDNYDGVEVSKFADIPIDYNGVMGVPLTFLGKHNPDQFEIVGITKTWFGAATKTYPQQEQVSANGNTSRVGKLNDGAVIKVDAPPAGKTYYRVDGECFIQTYPRVLIRRKDSQ
jgi:hypothetical protein